MLAIVSPGGLDGFFLEAGEEATEGSSPPEGEPDVDRIVQIGRRYGVEFPPPPGRLRRSVTDLSFAIDVGWGAQAGDVQASSRAGGAFFVGPRSCEAPGLLLALLFIRMPRACVLGIRVAPVGWRYTAAGNNTLR